MSPCSASSAITVGASTDNDGLASYSNIGEQPEGWLGSHSTDSVAAQDSDLHAHAFRGLVPPVWALCV
jgi:hypothetical protein